MAISDIGHEMRSIYTWFWMSCCLGWLIFPIIILLIKYFSLSSTLKAQNDPILQEAGDKLFWAAILNIIPSGITQLIGVIFMFLWIDQMQDWASKNGRTMAAAGFGQLKTAFILNIIPLGITQIIGIIFFLIGWPKAADGMM
jgi:hypothetical protein